MVVTSWEGCVQVDIVRFKGKVMVLYRFYFLMLEIQTAVCE